MGERVTDGSIGARFGFMVGAVELADRRHSSCQDGKVGGRADHVPSTLEYERFGVQEAWELRFNKSLE